MWLEELLYVNTIVIFKENSNGEGADLVLGAGGKGGVDGADDAQRLHDEGQHLWAELGGQLDQSLEDAGEEGAEGRGCSPTTSADHSTCSIEMTRLVGVQEHRGY